MADSLRALQGAGVPGNPLPECFALWAAPTSTSEHVEALAASVDPAKPDFFGATWISAILADASLKANRHAEAESLTAAGLLRAERSGERMLEAELLRLRARSLSRSDITESKRCFDQSATLARNQGSVALELRALLSLRDHPDVAGPIDFQMRTLLDRFPEPVESTLLHESRG